MATVSGCSKRETSAPATPAAPEKILRVSQRNEPATLDPQLATLPDEFFIIRALGEGLLTPNPVGGAPLAGVAEKWEVSPDGLTYAFHLRADAKWSNGDPVTADSFAAMIRRATAPGSIAPKAHLFAAVREMKAPDPRTLVISLKQRTADFPAIVASGPWIPAHEKPGIGNGPFVLSEWKPSQHIAVRKNSLYWDAARVKLDGIRFVAMDNGDSEERAFRAGQLDVTMAVPVTKIPGYRAAQPSVLRSVPLAETRYLALNTQRPPLNDPRVRQALALALDRTSLVEKVLQGGQQPAFHFVPAGLGDYAPGLRLTENAAQARELLAAAGFPGGKGFPRLELTAWPVSGGQLEAIQQMWRRELGIEVALAQREARTHLASLAAGDYAVAFMTAIPDCDGASDLFTQLTTGHAANYPHWSNPEYDRLAAAAQWAPAEKILLGDMPLIPLYFNSQNFLVAPRVKNWRADRLWTRFYRDVTVDR
ncbi:MAG: peptide ABC transporter substrate-binding protein [Opitutae bacterium]|nr:peptide ABC transporter substrate-binding protein [Opitutae bacterium]